MPDAESLRRSILAQVAEYYEVAHANQPFVPGESRVQYAGRVFDARNAEHGRRRARFLVDSRAVGAAI